MKHTIYVVWGPTMEWADHSGPLSYHASEEEAMEALRFYVEEARDSVADAEPDELSFYEKLAIDPDNYWVVEESIDYDGSIEELLEEYNNTW